MSILQNGEAKRKVSSIATAKQQSSQARTNRILNVDLVPANVKKASPSSDNSTIKVVIDNKVFSIDPTRLDEPEYRPKCFDRLAKATKIYLDGLLSLADKQRVTILRPIISNAGNPTFCVGTEKHRDLFRAVLAMIPKPDDLEKYKRGKLAALAVAALLHMDSLEVVCVQLKDRLKQLGVIGVKRDQLVSEVKKVAKEIGAATDVHGDPRPAQPVLDLFPDAPVAPEVIIPPDWIVEGESIISYTGDIFASITCPVVIAGRGRDASGTEQVCLAWRREGGWCQRMVNRETIANTRTIVELAAFGLPVTSNNARAVVQYLADYEIVNLEKLPTSLVSSQFGFQGDNGDRGFLLGKRLITAEGICDPQGVGAVPAAGSGVHVYFRGADEGDDQLADGFHEEGTYEGWLEAIAPLQNHPKARLALYASLTATILPVIGAPNFALDYAGESSKGKTVSICVAASCYGNPDLNGNKPRAISSWRSTGVCLERTPAVLRHVPFIVDDTVNALSNEDVSQIVYLVTQGRSKGRGSTKGVARQETYSTVLMSTGEQPIVSLTEKGGIRGRVLQFSGSPFEASPGIANVVSELLEQIKQNYGFAGPSFIQYLLQHRQQWPMWKRVYRRWREAFVERASGNALAGRLAANFASIEVAAYLAHKALDLPWAYESPTSELWDELTREAIDRASAALQHVMGWASSHRQEFSSNGHEGRQPADGWAGRWDRGGDASDNTERRINQARCKGRSVNELELWDWIGFYPHKLKKVLKDGGFEPEGIVRAWHGRGWLRTNPGRSTLKTRIDGTNTSVIAITREAVAETGG